MSTREPLAERPIFVIGDLILDHDHFVVWQRASPEDPRCPVTMPDHESWALGGAGNVAHWVAGLRPDAPPPVLCGHLSDCTLGERIRDLATRARVHAKGTLYAHDGEATVKERIYLKGDDGRWAQHLRIDRDTKAQLTHEQAECTLARLIGDVGVPSLIVIADYGKSVFQGPAVGQFQRAILREASQRGIPILLNTKHPATWVDCDVDFLVCNQHEYQQIAPRPTHAHHTIVTMAEQGVRAVVNGGTAWARLTVSEESMADTVCDVTGAGDAFLAGLAVKAAQEGFRRDQRLDEAALRAYLHAGQSAAAACCQQYGVGIPGWYTVEERLELKGSE